MQCANCEKETQELFKTAYGDFLCEECWDTYFNADESDAGLVEYVIGICLGGWPIEGFGADFLYKAIKSYQLNYEKLNLTEEQQLELENKAKELGLI